MNRCELSFLERQEIDIHKAAAQHRSYNECLAALGLNPISLPPEPDLPDSVFVEDPAVVVDEVAVMTNMGAESRRKEGETLASALSKYRPLRYIESPGTLEGGDVMRIDRRIFVGASHRSNAAGIAQLAAVLEPFGYSVEPVDVRGCLHLKSACTYLGDGALLANREWIDMAPFEGLRIIDVVEPAAANTLTVAGTTIIPSAYPETAAKLEKLGYRVQRVDVSELIKAEAGVTCCSLIFTSQCKT